MIKYLAPLRVLANFKLLLYSKFENTQYPNELIIKYLSPPRVLANSKLLLHPKLIDRKIFSPIKSFCKLQTTRAPQIWEHPLFKLTDNKIFSPIKSSRGLQTTPAPQIRKHPLSKLTDN